MIRSSNLITIDFTTPTKLNLDDQVSLRDLYERLLELHSIDKATRFNDWVKRRIEFYVEDVDFIVVTHKEVTVDRHGFSRASTTKEYHTTVQIAMELLANGNGKAGHEMRQFMSACVRQVSESKVVEGQQKLPFDISDPDSILTYAREVYIKEHTLRLVAEDQADKEKAAREEAERLRNKIHKSRESTSTAKLGGLTASHNRLKEKIKLLEEKLPADEEVWKTAAGWKKVTPEFKDKSELSLGQALTKFFNTNNLEIRTIPDIKFGKLNIYAEVGVKSYLTTLLLET